MYEFNPTISNHADRLPRTQFGQALLDDFGPLDLAPEGDTWAEEGMDDRLDIAINRILGGDEPVAYPWPGNSPKQAIVAWIDMDEPAKQYQDGLDTKEPDFLDDGRAYWITDNAVVSCEQAMIPALGHLASRSGWLIRQGEFPAMHGVAVETFDRAFMLEVPSIWGTKVSRAAWSQWTLFVDACIVPEEL